MENAWPPDFLFALQTGDFGWLLVVASSCACCLGASVVFLDRFTSRFYSGKGFSLEASPRFLAASLSLASGVMLFSALFSLLPEAVGDLMKATPGVRNRAAQVAIGLYFAGVAFTLFVNRVVRWMTPGSACPCNGPSGEYRGRELPQFAEDHTPPATSAESLNSWSNHGVSSQEVEDDGPGDCRQMKRSSERSALRCGTLPEQPSEQLPDGNTIESLPVSYSRPTSAPKLENVYHCQGLYEDHAFLHQHQHISRPKIPVAEVSDGGRFHASSTSPKRYGTFGRRNSYPVSTSHQYQESQHHHHQHHYPHPYQNIPYKCSSNITLNNPALRSHPISGMSRPLLQPPSDGTQFSQDVAEEEDNALRNVETNGPVAHDKCDVLPYYVDSPCDIEDGRSRSRHAMREVDECSINSSTRPCPEAEKKDREDLLRIGVQTAVAISLHKFPEGLITFVGTKASTAMGFSVFLAIFIHNIPEGLMIAVPLLVATSSRAKAFMLAAILGGLSQPMGAAVGYLILPSDIQDPDIRTPGVNAAYGSLFAFVSGLMTCVVIQGMLPAAVRFNPSGQIVTMGFFSGVALVGVTWAFLGGGV